MKRLFEYYKYNFFSIFLVGLLGGAVCLMLHIILSGIASENLIFDYTATTKIALLDNETVTEKKCYELVKDQDVKETIKGYLGSYISYDEFIKNFELSLKDAMLIIKYTNENSDRAKRSANRLGNVLCRKLINIGEIKNYERVGITEITRNKRYKDNAITKLQITLFVEFGVIVGLAVGFVIWTFIYCVNGRIKSKKDIEDELNIIVLAEIPHISNLREVR